MHTRFCFSLLLAPIVLTCQAGGQPVQPKLSAAVGRYTINARTSLDALVKVAGDFQLPMGIEWIKVVNPPTPLSRSWQDSTAIQILQDVVKAYPEYQVETNGPVVHVFPAALRGDAADVLNARIGPFEVADVVVPEASFRLERQVRELMIPPDPQARAGGYMSSIAHGSEDRPVSFKLEDATVRDALDSLCLAADRKIWIVAYPPAPAPLARISHHEHGAYEAASKSAIQI